MFFLFIYWRGGDLGRVTLTIYINFHSPFPRRINIKFGSVHCFSLTLIGQDFSVEKMFENVGHIHVHSPGTGTDNTLGQNNSFTVQFSRDERAGEKTTRLHCV